MKHKLTVLCSGLLMANIVSAATIVDLRHQPVGAERKMTGVELKQLRVDVDFNQTSHARMQQTFNGYPVWNATSVVHTPVANARGLKQFMNGVVYQGLARDLATTSLSTLTTAQQQKALHQAQSDYRNDNHLPAGIKFNDESVETVVYVDDKNQAHYAYHVTFYHDDGRTGAHRPNLIMDANNFRVYRQWDQVIYSKMHVAQGAQFKQQQPSMTVLAGGIGGNEKMGQRIYDGLQGHLPALEMDHAELAGEEGGVSFKMSICALNNKDIEVRDVSFDNGLITTLCSFSPEKHGNVYWLSNDTNETRWKNDEANGANSPSLDAFYGAAMVRNMYRDWYGIAPLVNADGTPMKMVMRTHYGRHFDNAFWDGKQMTFGDGDRRFYPLTSIDVTAHEISHGFTELHSNIDYSKPQMGALHESFSDMAASAVQYYTTGEQVWALARDVWKNEGAMRYMDNPRKDGRSIDNLKDFDATESHAGGGITNKAFYLMATSKGWDTRMAFNIWVKANMNYWTSSMNTLNEAACGVVAATKDYGYDVSAVHVAFSKVGIDSTGC